MQSSREIQYERQLLARIGLSRPKIFPKECAWYRRDGTLQSPRAPADAYHRIKYLERGLIPDLGQLVGAVPEGTENYLFTLRLQGMSYREIARETGMSKSSVGRILGSFMPQTSPLKKGI